jgi:hAT family C-terminal dimerisation region
MSFPNLSRLALDILSIPAMSADPERLFSSTKLLISYLRNKLGMDIIEAFKCLKSWYRIKGWEGEFKYLEEVIGAEVEKMEVDHVQTE